MSDRTDALQLPPELEELSRLRHEFEGLMLRYKFGIDEMMTKLNILKEEAAHRSEYSPIEHVSSRLKSPESILAKAVRKGLDPTVTEISENIHDVAGIRVTCSFISDVYRIVEMVSAQPDVTVLELRDYIAHPKSNGYQSLHLIVQVPVFLSDQVHNVTIEIQIRTIAMDFWASLEHKIFYKYAGEVPDNLLGELRDAAETAARLDVTMERLHDDVRALKVDSSRYIDPLTVGALDLPDALLRTFLPANTKPVPAPLEQPRPSSNDA